MLHPIPKTKVSRIKGFDKNSDSFYTLMEVINSNKIYLERYKKKCTSLIKDVIDGGNYQRYKSIFFKSFYNNGKFLEDCIYHHNKNRKTVSQREINVYGEHFSKLLVLGTLNMFGQSLSMKDVNKYIIDDEVKKNIKELSTNRGIDVFNDFFPKSDMVKNVKNRR